MSIFTEEIGRRGISPLPQASQGIISNRGSRTSNFTKRPPWSIPSISGMVNQTDSTEKMVVRDIILGANISNNLADMTLSQTFRNTTERSVECVYQFPISEEFVVSGITAIMEDKTIETQIMEKEKANQKYDDTIAQGSTAIKMEYDEENQKVLTLNIGHLQKDKEVQIIIRISTKCHSFKHGEYTFVFPLNFLPSFMSMEDSQFKVIKPTFSCKIKLK